MGIFKGRVYLGWAYTGYIQGIYTLRIQDGYVSGIFRVCHHEIYPIWRVFWEGYIEGILFVWWVYTR